MTSEKKQIKLGVFLADTGHHVASWQHRTRRQMRA